MILFGGEALAPFGVGQVHLVHDRDVVLGAFGVKESRLARLFAPC
jgi:hypothetical protein